MTIEGEVVNILFTNEDNGYTVAYIKPKTDKKNIVIVGTLPQLRLGESLICEGDWIQHKKFGEQFEVSSFQVLRPKSKEGMKKYLSGGWIKGIGPKIAERIIDRFGLETFDIIEQEPFRLKELKLPQRILDNLLNAWGEQHEARDIILFLQSYQISPNFAQKIYKEYGKKSIAAIRQNPYTLARDIIGISFIKADEIARNMDIAHDDNRRLEAGILFMLQELANQQGHTTIPLTELTTRAISFMKVEEVLIQNALEQLLKKKKITIDNLSIKGENIAFVWLQRFYEFENHIVENLKRIKEHKPIQFKSYKKALGNVLDELKIELAEQQKNAILGALKNKIHIITGGAGTGKSTIINVLLNTWENHTEKVALAAPTGRAAKRLSEITKHPASTLHSLLQTTAAEIVSTKIFVSSLDADVIIVDEASMIDTPLFMVLLKAIPDKAHLILVGDIDQLPSVGAGNILHDLIASEYIPVTRLTEIFRQSAASKIIQYAHDVRIGNYPQIVNSKDSDCFFMPQNNAQEALDLLGELVLKRLPNTYNFDSLKDIQVISPMNKGALGTKVINQYLQQAINPNIHDSKKHFKFGDMIYAIGDKVIQTKNNYDKNVFNGDIGYITRIDKEDNLHWIDFEGREVEFKLTDCTELDLAYAISVHKYQGSESPAVILFLSEAHFMLLSRNLLYTAMTRGKKLLIMLGSQKAIHLAVSNNESILRNTGLLQMLAKDTFLRLPPIQTIPMLGSTEYEDFIIKQNLV